MTTTVAGAEGRRLDLEERLPQAPTGTPAGEADDQASTRRFHVTVLSLIAVAQLVWVAGLVYGIWLVLF